MEKLECYKWSRCFTIHMEYSYQNNKMINISTSNINSTSSGNISYSYCPKCGALVKHNEVHQCILTSSRTDDLIGV